MEDCETGNCQWCNGYQTGINSIVPLIIDAVLDSGSDKTSEILVQIAKIKDEYL